MRKWCVRCSESAHPQLAKVSDVKVPVGQNIALHIPIAARNCTFHIFAFPGSVRLISPHSLLRHEKTIVHGEARWVRDVFVIWYNFFRMQKLRYSLQKIPKSTNTKGSLRPACSRSERTCWYYTTTKKSVFQILSSRVIHRPLPPPPPPTPTPIPRLLETWSDVRLWQTEVKQNFSLRFVEFCFTLMWSSQLTGLSISGKKLVSLGTMRLINCAVGTTERGLCHQSLCLSEPTPLFH